MAIEVELFESPGLNPLNFCLWGCMNSGDKKEKWVRKVNYSLALWILLSTQRNIRIASDEQHAIFGHEL
jgi:hypothetical protein